MAIYLLYFDRALLSHGVQLINIV